jgi:hypothetical protein
MFLDLRLEQVEHLRRDLRERCRRARRRRGGRGSRLADGLPHFRQGGPQRSDFLTETREVGLHPRQFRRRGCRRRRLCRERRGHQQHHADRLQGAYERVDGEHAADCTAAGAATIAALQKSPNDYRTLTSTGLGAAVGAHQSWGLRL